MWIVGRRKYSGSTQIVFACALIAAPLHVPTIFGISHAVDSSSQSKIFVTIKSYFNSLLLISSFNPWFLLS